MATLITASVLEAILDERRHQDARFGGAGNDDRQTLRHWCRVVHGLHGELCDAATRIEEERRLQVVVPLGPTLARLVAIQIAATAIALAESLDRIGPAEVTG